jgi:tetratricopeptide (TPR) repeat protein/TolB-like protein
MAAAGIAVMPFDVVGEDLDVWREGMVDVLATNLDGMGGYRAIDSRTVLARWREHVTGDDIPDLETSLQAAGSTGARYGLMGSMVGSPAGVRINAELYDLSNGEEIVQVFTEGPADSVLALVGALSVSLTRDLLAETGQDLIAAPRTASLTTTSLPALRAYLEGEAVFRRSDFAGAVAAYERAVETDSTFALAWFRLADAYGWLDNQGNVQAINANARAAELADQLPVRDRLLLRAANALSERDLSYVQELRDAARNYPDDPEIWFSIGEFYIHGGKSAGYGTWDDINNAFSKAVELDPSFSPYQVHWVEGAIIAGDTATAAAALQAYRASTVDDERTEHLELMYELFLTDETRREAALAGLGNAPERSLMNAGQWGKAAYPDQAWVERVARRAYEINGHEWWFFTAADAMLSRGRFADLNEWIADPSGPMGVRWAYAELAQRLGQPPADWLLQVVDDEPGLCVGDDPGLGCSLSVGRMAIELGWEGVPELLAANRLHAGLPTDGAEEEQHALDHADRVAFLEGYLAILESADTARALRELRPLRHTFTGAQGDGPWTATWRPSRGCARVRSTRSRGTRPRRSRPTVLHGAACSTPTRATSGPRWPGKESTAWAAEAGRMGLGPQGPATAGEPRNIGTPGTVPHYAA